MEFQTVVTVLCRLNGVVTTILHDDLGLDSCVRPESSLRTLVEPASAGELDRLFREIRENGLALDIHIQIRCQGISIPLWMSGYATDDGVHLIGSKQTLSRESLVHEIVRHAIHEKRAALTRDALLALTAHDLRNHLNGILAANQYLLDDAAGLLEPEHVMLLQSIESSTTEMFRVIDDVSQVAALESATPPPELKPTNVVAVVGKSLAANRSRAERKKVTLELAPETAVPLIAADPGRADRVTDSLLAIATDITAAGGKIEVSLTAKGQRTLVSVRVQSSNLTDEEFRSILDASHPTVAGVKAGTVLGLRVMSRMVEKLGGSIEVASAASTELTITLALPVWDETAIRSHGV